MDYPLTHPAILRALEFGSYEPSETEYICPKCGHELDSRDGVYERDFNKYAGCEYCLTRSNASEVLKPVPAL